MIGFFPLAQQQEKQKHLISNWRQRWTGAMLNWQIDLFYSENYIIIIIIMRNWFEIFRNSFILPPLLFVNVSCILSTWARFGQKTFFGIVFNLIYSQRDGMLRTCSPSLDEMQIWGDWMNGRKKKKGFRLHVASRSDSYLRACIKTAHLFISVLLSKRVNLSTWRVMGMPHIPGNATMIMHRLFFSFL